MAKEDLAKEESALQKGRQYVAEQALEIWDSLGKNNLWKRILKNVIATTLLGQIFFRNQYRRDRSLLLQSAYVSSQDHEMPLAKQHISVRLRPFLAIQGDDSAKWQKH